VFAETDETIVSCVAILPEGNGVSLSTFACRNDMKSKLASAYLWEKSLKISEKECNASFIETDSWVGNTFIDMFLTSKGFEKIKTFQDTDKRPPGIKSVLYRKELN
jgi:hypothetical protein